MHTDPKPLVDSEPTHSLIDRHRGPLPAWKRGSVELPSEVFAIPDAMELQEMWRIMVTIREFETRISRIAESKEVEGYLHTYAGHEAVAAGIIPALRSDDWLTSTYRNHGHAIARGVSLQGIAGEIFGKDTGVCKGKGGSMHVADQDLGMIGAMGIVAGGLPVATGAAFTARYRGEDRVAASFFGEGAVHQGAWHEALEFASLFSCPVLFVCENNLYAETTASDYHLISQSVSHMAAQYRIPAIQVDGMDVLAVRRASQRALHTMRTTGSPVLIETLGYRYGGQYEGDTQTYKPEAEVAYWRARDPLTLFRSFVTENELLAVETLDQVRERQVEAVEDAFTAARDAHAPDPSTAFTDVYAAQLGDRLGFALPQPISN